jgi:pantoate--beta-alanine ligase
VATVVSKLFNIVQPTDAYFGQKDAAQCVVIRRMVQDLNMDINIHIHDTLREPDGLALSSRNTYLTATERKAAPIVYQSLCQALVLWNQYNQQGASSSTGLPAEDLQQAVLKKLSTEPLVTKVHYVSIDDRETMKSLTHVYPQCGAVVSIACQLGNVRLIDNIILS